MLNVLRCIMDIIQIVILILLTTEVISRTRKNKYVASTSDETIENLLYFKDCQKKPKEQTTTTTVSAPKAPLRMPITPPTTPPAQPACPFPKMCCSLSCGNDCGENKQNSIFGKQMNPAQGFAYNTMNIEPRPLSLSPIKPVHPHPKKRKKINVQQPLPPTRRDLGTAKNQIKSLISQDDDIRKILKDLVRVTMQKIDLLEMMKDSPTTDSDPADGNSYTATTTEGDNVYDDYVE